MAGDQSSSMGAVIYFGLIGLTLISAGPSDVRYLNPQETMRRSQFQEPPVDAKPIEQFSWPVVTQNADQALIEVDQQDLPVEQAEAAITRPIPAPRVFAANTIVDSLLAPQFEGRPFEVRALDRYVRDIKNLSNTGLGVPNADDEHFENVFGSPVLPDIHLFETPSLRAPEEHQIASIPITDRLLDWLRGGKPVSPTLDEFERRDRPAWNALVTGDRVYLRSAPSLEGTPLSLIALGTIGTVTQSRGDWVRIEISEQTGWMFAGFVTPQ